MRHSRTLGQGLGVRLARNTVLEDYFDGTRAGAGAVWTPVGARAVAEPSRSPWIVAQPAAGNTQAAAVTGVGQTRFPGSKTKKESHAGSFKRKAVFGNKTFL